MGPPCHQTETRVIYAATDAMGVVYYAEYFRWFEIGRTELMRHVGISYKEMEEQGTYLPVAEVFCKYWVSARYDDVLVIETRVDFMKRASIQFSYRIFRKADGVNLVTGSTRHAFVNREGQIVKAPQLLLEKMKPND